MSVTTGILSTLLERALVAVLVGTSVAVYVSAAAMVVALWRRCGEAYDRWLYSR